MPSFNGFLERYNSKVISGWAKFDHEVKDKTLQIKINGEIIGETTPSMERDDFSGEKIGFMLDISNLATPQKACKLEVVSKIDGAHIGNSPVVILLANETSRNEVIKGTGEQLFLANGTNRVIDQITGKYHLSDESIQDWSNFASNLAALSTKLDCRFLVVPNKECVLEDHLPSELRISGMRPLTEVSNILAMKWPKFHDCFVYPIGLLRGNKMGQNFTPGDTHWTNYGAWHGVEALFRDTYTDAVQELSKLIRSSRKIYRYENADLLSKLGGACIEPKPSPLLDWSTRKVFDNGGINTSQETTWVCNNSLLNKKIAFYHDSFGPQMVPYLTKLFGEVHTFWSPSISEKTLRKLEPDILIIERIERFLILPSKLT